jgi:hypothetical protein
MIKKILILLTMGVGAFTQSNAQFSMGLLAGYETMANLQKPVGGITLEYGFSAKLAGRLNVFGFLPASETAQYSAVALSSSTVPQYLPVDYTFKVQILGAQVSAKYYFGREREKAVGGFYAGAGVGFLMARVSESLGTYDKALYSAGSTNGNESFYQPFIVPMAGYDIKLNDRMYISPELGFFLAANQVNGQQIDVTMPSFLMGHISWRVFLSSMEDYY